MTILALDCGNKTGWARSGDRFGGPPTSSVQDFTPKPGELDGVRWSRFNDWLTRMLDTRPELVVYERWTRGPGDAPKIRAGFITRVEERCDARGIERLEVSPAELKLWTTGKGNASKLQMISAVQHRGWSDKLDLKDDEADALALLHYAREEIVCRATSWRRRRGRSSSNGVGSAP